MNTQAISFLFSTLLLSGCSISNDLYNSKINSTSEDINLSYDNCNNDTEMVLLSLKKADVTVRVVLCSNYSDKSYVNQIVYRGVDKQYIVFSKSDILEQKNIADALFNNTQNFSILANHLEKKLIIRGTDNYGEWSAVLNDTDKIIATPDYSDPFGPCAASNSGNTYNIRKLNVGTANIDLHVCSGGIGTIGTFDYTIVGIDITDNSNNLKEPINIKLKEFELSKAIFEKKYHHNVCNTLVISLDEVKYGMVAVGGARGPQEGCESINDAPLSDSKFSTYKVTYNNGKVIMGKLTVENYYRY